MRDKTLLMKCKEQGGDKIYFAKEKKRNEPLIFFYSNSNLFHFVNFISDSTKTFTK